VEQPQVIVKASAVVAVVAIILAVIGAILYGLERRARLAEQKAAEAAALTQKGLLVEAQESADDLQRTVKGMEAESKLLHDALDDARARGPKLVPVEVSRLITRTVVVPTPAESTPCVLAPGDGAQIRVTEVRLQTSLGNEVVTGTAAAWRMTPTESKLFESTFEASASSVQRSKAAAPPEPPGWGFGLQAIYSKGATVGPAVSPPVVEVLGFKLEASASIGFGNGVSGALSALVRR